MSTALQTINEWTPQQLELITSTVAKGATRDELQLFLYRCKNMGLDPLKPGRVHFIKYGNNPGSIVVGIEGIRTLAHRTGKVAGINRGVIKDDKGNILGAWCEVHRKDWTQPAREEISFSEYNTGKAMWAKMPEQMLKKCAEAAALRMAFPEDLGSIYESAEMDRADSGVRPEQPAPGDGVQSDAYHFGSMAGPRLVNRPIDKVSTQDLKAFVAKMDAKYGDKEMPPKTKEAHQNAIEEIIRRETGEPIEVEADEVPEWEKEVDKLGVIKK